MIPVEEPPPPPPAPKPENIIHLMRENAMKAKQREDMEKDAQVEKGKRFSATQEQSFFYLVCYIW